MKKSYDKRVKIWADCQFGVFYCAGFDVGTVAGGERKESELAGPTLKAPEDRT